MLGLTVAGSAVGADLTLLVGYQYNSEFEVGDDNGDFLPENKAGWAVTHFDP